MALLEESETHINYDYASKEVEIFTTRRGVYQKLIERIGEKNIPYHGGNLDTGWKVRAPLEFFREPYRISKVIK